MCQWNFSRVSHGLLSSSDTFENIALHPNKVKERPIFRASGLTSNVASSNLPHASPSVSNSITETPGDGPNKTVCFPLRVKKNYATYKFTMKPCCLLWTSSDIHVILVRNPVISLVNTVCKSSIQWKTKQIQSFIKELSINKLLSLCNPTTGLDGLLPPPPPPSSLIMPSPFLAEFAPTVSSGAPHWGGLWF